MNKAFIACAILAASYSALAQGEAYANPKVGAAGVTRAQVLQQASGPIVSGEMAYSAGAPASTALSRGSGSTSAMGASAEPPQERLTRAKVRAELDAAVYKGQLGFGDFGAMPTRGSMGSQIIGQ